MEHSIYKRIIDSNGNKDAGRQNSEHRDSIMGIMDKALNWRCGCEGNKRMAVGNPRYFGTVCVVFNFRRFSVRPAFSTDFSIKK